MHTRNASKSSTKIRKPHRIRKWFCLILLLCPLVTSGQRFSYPPVNQVYRDSSLTAFICRLQYAIFRKDAGFLLSIVDPDIKLSFGDASGLQDFKTMWKPEDTGSYIWPLLSKLISLGGVKSNYGTTGNCYVFPYVFDITFPSGQNDLDGFTALVVTGSNVNVREKPSANAPKTGQLSYELVKVDYEKSYPPFEDTPLSGMTYFGPKEWYYISTPDGKVNGYIYHEYVWSPVDYRLFLEKQSSGWKIVCLIAGD